MSLFRRSGIARAALNSSVHMRLDADGARDDIPGGLNRPRNRSTTPTGDREAAAARNFPGNGQSLLNQHIPGYGRLRRVNRHASRGVHAAGFAVDRDLRRIHGIACGSRYHYIAGLFDVNKGFRRLPPKSPDIKTVAHVEASEGSGLNRLFPAGKRGNILLCEDCESYVPGLGSQTIAAEPCCNRNQRSLGMLTLCSAFPSASRCWIRGVADK